MKVLGVHHPGVSNYYGPQKARPGIASMVVFGDTESVEWLKPTKQRARRETAPFPRPEEELVMRVDEEVLFRSEL